MKSLGDGLKFCCGAIRYYVAYLSGYFRLHLRIHVLRLSHFREMHALLSCYDDRRKTHHQILLNRHLTAISKLVHSEVSIPPCDNFDVHLL